MQQAPPSVRRIVVGNGGRRSSIDNGLDSSFSESEGFNGENEIQVRSTEKLTAIQTNFNSLLCDVLDILNFNLNVTNSLVRGPRSPMTTSKTRSNMS